MFFDDASDLGPPRKSVQLKALLPTPETGWRPPTSFPNLSSASAISFDVETKEPDFDHGPGWARGKGHIVGIGIGAEDIYGNIGNWYFPMRHTIDTDLNCNPDHVINFARHVLQTPNIPKVGANLKYDIGWLAEENIFVQGELHDVQHAETLITYDGLVALDHLGAKYCGEHKASALMYQWQADNYGGAVGGKQRANIWRTSPKLVGAYGEGDVSLPLRIRRAQRPALDTLDLDRLYRIECDLIYLLVRMRREGVSVDLPHVERLYAELTRDATRLNLLLAHEVGFMINVNSPTDIARAFDKYGLRYGKTDAGKPSFTKPFLQTVAHPIADSIIEIRMVNKIKDTFLRSYILESHVNGKVFCNFNQLKGEEGGAGTGRFSSSEPNLQNIPVRPGPTEEKLLKKESPHYDPNYVAIGVRVRRAFIPDRGHYCWEKQDLSQIQYRYLAHFAVGGGADALRQAYIDKPDTDYHDLVQALVLKVTGILIPRRPIKNINFGLLFGMGKEKVKRQIGGTSSEGNAIYASYHEGAPYVKATMKWAERQALQTGMTRTILGRICRFDKWEEKDADREQPRYSTDYENAIRMWGTKIQRSDGFKALCDILQGSEGDHMKSAMHRCMKEGVYDYTGVPRITVHDELGYSVRDNSLAMQEAMQYNAHVLANAIPLRVPVYVEPGRGANWGDSE